MTKRSSSSPAPNEFGDAQATLLLIERALAHDRAAGKALVERLTPVLVARVRRYARASRGRLGPIEVDEAVQQLWVALLQDDGHLLRLWDAKRSTRLESFVAAVADKKLSDMRRHMTARRRSGISVHPDGLAEAPSPEPGPDVILAMHRLLEAVHQAMGAKGQQIMVALCAPSADPRCVASVLDVERQVIYNWSHRIREFITQSAHS